MWPPLVIAYHFITASAVNIFAAIGVLAVLFAFADSLFNTVPKLVDLKSKFWRWLADTYNFRKAKKMAVKTEMEKIVNQVVFQLQDELPKDWIQRAAIKWVKDITAPSETPEGEVILRVRPNTDQNLSLAYGVHSFFTRALFPKIGDLIPAERRNGAILLVTRRALASHSPSLRTLFEDNLLEQAIRTNPDVLASFNEFETLDNRGFFTSALLREMHEVTLLARFRPLRTTIGTELTSIVQHMLTFARQLGTGTITTVRWSRKGPVTSYAFLLVARPDNNGVRNYIVRARERLAEGITRLYILAREEQKDFALQVIREISQLPEYRLDDTFGLSKDYRCHEGGIGALLVVDHPIEADAESVAAAPQLAAVGNSMSIAGTNP